MRFPNKQQQQQQQQPVRTSTVQSSDYHLYSFSGDRRFCYDNHGSFVYDSPNLFCGPSGSVRTGLTGVRSKPGHRTHLTSLFHSLTWLSMRMYIFSGFFFFIKFFGFVQGKSSACSDSVCFCFPFLLPFSEFGESRKLL